MTETINFWDEVKKGISGGFLLGIVFGITVLLLSNDSGMPFFTDTNVALLVISAITGAILGGIGASIIVGIIGTLKLIQWSLFFLEGSIISILTAIWGGLVGWITLILLPIVYIART
jgi:hypothetical protein